MKKRRDKEYVERMKNIGEFCLEINSIEDVQSIWIVINEMMDFQGLGIAREIRDSTYPTICQHPYSQFIRVRPRFESLEGRLTRLSLETH